MCAGRPGGWGPTKRLSDGGTGWLYGRAPFENHSNGGSQVYPPKAWGTSSKVDCCAVLRSHQDLCSRACSCHIRPPFQYAEKTNHPRTFSLCSSRSTSPLLLFILLRTSYICTRLIVLIVGAILLLKSDKTFGHRIDSFYVGWLVRYEFIFEWSGLQPSFENVYRRPVVYILNLLDDKIKPAHESTDGLPPCLLLLPGLCFSGSLSFCPCLVTLRAILCPSFPPLVGRILLKSDRVTLDPGLAEVSLSSTNLFNDGLFRGCKLFENCLR